MSQLPPLCRYCGKPIKRRTVEVVFLSERKPYHHDYSFSRHLVVENLPSTREAAQRLVNQSIIRTQVAGGLISSVITWDGESYLDDYFCKNVCAEKFGRLMAKRHNTWATEVYWDAVEKQGSRLANK